MNSRTTYRYNRSSIRATKLPDCAAIGKNKCQRNYAGLNVSHFIIGAGVLRFGDTSRLRQFGSFVMVQGVFVLLYDLVLLRKSTRYLKLWTENSNWNINPGLLY